MKRLNQKTGKPFKSGDTREDGMVFRSYQLKRRLPSDTQYFYENWYSPEAFKAKKAYTSERTKKFHKTKRDASKTTGVKGNRRLNPSTGKEYALGEPNEDQSRYFQAYDNWHIDPDGYCRMLWLTKPAIEQWRKTARLSQRTLRENDRIGFALKKAKRRAKEKEILFDLGVEHLEDVFPTDNLCPVFGIPFEWGGGSDETSRDNSPSLDRIIPKLGYVEGNVVWISNRANILKRDATWEELYKVAAWLKSVTHE